MQLHYPLNPTTGVEDQTQLPWTNGVPQTGQNGSFPPFAAVVDPMTELVNLIALAGITPSDGDMDQVTRAVRGGQLDFDATDTGTADAVLCQVGLAHTAIAAGLPFTFVKGPAANTGNAVPTLTITDFAGNNALTGTIVKAGGGAISKGDLPANALITVRARAPGVFAVVSLLTISDVIALINAQVSANFIISTGLSIQVGGTAPAASTTAYPNYFATLAAAFAWVSAYTITATGSVGFVLAAGQTVAASGSLLSLNHPNGNRIFIIGAAMKGGVPNASSFAATGNTTTARANDKATNLAAMRALYGSELLFQSGGGLVINGAGLNITNVLCTGDGSTQNLVTVQSGAVSMTGSTAGGAGNHGVLITQNGAMVASNCHTFGCGANGWSVEEGGHLTGSVQLSSHGTAIHGVNASGAGTIYMDQAAGAASIFSLYSGGNDLNASNGTVNCGPAALIRGGVGGVVADNNSTVIADGAISDAHGTGFAATDRSFISARGSPVGGANTAYGYTATNASTIVMSGGNNTGSTAQSSPALNTVGNSNSIVIQ